MGMPVDKTCESVKVVKKVEGFGGWAKLKRDAGRSGPSCHAGMAPQERRRVAWLVLCAPGRCTLEFIVLLDCGRCSFHVRNRGPIQATPKSKVTSKFGWIIA